MAMHFTQADVPSVASVDGATGISMVLKDKNLEGDAAAC